MKYLQVPKTHKLDKDLREYQAALEAFVSAEGSQRRGALESLALKGLPLVARLEGALAVLEHEN